MSRRPTPKPTPKTRDGAQKPGGKKNQDKPVWPFPDQVERYRKSDPGMTAHLGSGQWCKRHRGKLYYFGPLDDPEAALAEYRRRWPSIKAGRPTAPASANAISVKDLTNLYHDRVKRKNRSPHTVAKVRRYARLIGPVLGLTRDAHSIGPADFARLRDALDGYAPTTAADVITYARSIFEWGHAARLLDTPPDFGPDFDKPTARELARWRESQRQKRPPLIHPQTFRALLGVADVTWGRAVLLMGMNCGFNAADLAIITPQHIRLPKRDGEYGWLDATRAKNAMPRLGELWPETVEAIRPYVESAGRLEPIFRTRTGRPLVGRSSTGKSGTNAVKNRFDRWRIAAGCEHHVFLDLRRTFSTVGLAVSDQETVRIVMGHSQTKNITMTYAQRYPPWKVKDCCRGVRAAMLGVKWERAREERLSGRAVAREVFG